MKSFLSLLPLYAQIGFNIYFLVFDKTSLNQLLFINLLWGLLISFPGLRIFLNYWNKSRNTKLILKYNTITLISPNRQTELMNSDISKIEIHEIRSDNRFPWGFYYYCTFYTEGNSISFNHFTAEISDIWQSSLSQKISSDHIEHIYSWYPIMKMGSQNNS